MKLSRPAASLDGKLGHLIVPSLMAKFLQNFLGSSDTKRYTHYTTQIISVYVTEYSKILKLINGQILSQMA